LIMKENSFPSPPPVSVAAPRISGLPDRAVEPTRLAETSEGVDHA